MKDLNVSAAALKSVMECLCSMNRRDLIAIQSELTTIIKDATIKEIAEARIQIHEIAKSIGMNVRDLIIAQQQVKQKTKNIAKYKNPNDAAQTWTGTGKRPHWVVAWDAMGKNISDLEIK